MLGPRLKRQIFLRIGHSDIRSCVDMSVVSSRTVHVRISTGMREVANLNTYGLEPVLARPSRACTFSYLSQIIITGLVCEFLIIMGRVVAHGPTVLGRIRTLSIKWQGAHVNRPHRS